MSEDTALFRVDIGCGSNKKNGFIGVDYQQFEGVDLVVDLTTERIPLPDRSAGYIYSSHFFEHIKSPNNVFSEISRIAADGAVLEIWTPYAYSDSAFCYGHEVFVTAELWRQICVEHPDFYYPIINARWFLKKIVYVIDIDAYDEIVENGFNIEFAIKYFKGVVHEIGAFVEIRHTQGSTKAQPEQFYAFSRDDGKYCPFANERDGGRNSAHGYIAPNRSGLLQRSIYCLRENGLRYTLRRGWGR